MHYAWFVLNRGVIVGQVRNGSGVRSANVGRTRSVPIQSTDGIVCICHNCESGDSNLTLARTWGGVNATPR